MTGKKCPFLQVFSRLCNLSFARGASLPYDPGMQILGTTATSDPNYGGVLFASDPPPTLRAAMESLGLLHSVYDRLPGATAGDSSRSCVFSATTARDTLRAHGFVSARCASVTVAMCAHRNGTRTDFAIGRKHDRKLPSNKWNGHLVTLCDDYLIDLTLYGPPQWLGPRGMIALRQRPKGYARLLDLDVIAHLQVKASHGYSFEILWLDNPDNQSWLSMRDARMTPEKKRVIETLSLPTGAHGRDDFRRGVCERNGPAE